MHLTFAHHSMSSTEAQRSAIKSLLGQLGFGAAPSPDAANGSETIFTVNVSLDEQAVRAFVSDADEESWNRDYRNTARRLFSDPLFDDRTLFNNGPRIADAEAGVVNTDLWNDTWTDTSRQKFVSDARAAKLDINGKALHVVSAGTIVPPWLELDQLIVRRPNGLRALSALRDAVNDPTIGTRAGLEKLAAKSGAFFAATGLEIAQNPMFTFWFVIARLCRLGPAVLSHAKGVATFRVRPQPTADLGDPLQWSLQPNVGVPAATISALHVFPF
jgi:hypothetical protein